jgi:hypothetical protein
MTRSPLNFLASRVCRSARHPVTVEDGIQLPVEAPIGGLADPVVAPV